MRQMNYKILWSYILHLDMVKCRVNEPFVYDVSDYDKLSAEPDMSCHTRESKGYSV